MFTTPFLFFSVHASEEEKKKAREKRKVRKKKYLGFDFFFRVFLFVCSTKNESAKDSSYSSEFYSQNTLITNSLIKNVFCAHRKLTGRLERAQRGARGRLRQRGHVLECVLFVLFLSLFLAFVMMMNEILRKRRKEILVIIIIEIDDSLARMKRDNYLLFLRRATLFFHRETFFLAQKCVLFTFLARTSKVLLSSKHTSRAGFFSFRRIDDSR